MNNIIINIILFTNNGKKLAGKITFDILKCIINQEFRQKIHLENCPDKKASLAFSFKYFVKKKNSTSNINNFTPISNHSVSNYSFMSSISSNNDINSHFKNSTSSISYSAL